MQANNPYQSYKHTNTFFLISYKHTNTYKYHNTEDILLFLTAMKVGGTAHLFDYLHIWLYELMQINNLLKNRSHNLLKNRNSYPKFPILNKRMVLFQMAILKKVSR